MWLEMLDGDMVNIGEAMFVRVEELAKADEGKNVSRMNVSPLCI